MTEIYIARHGQNVDNKNKILNGHRDEPLTELGEEQARTVGKEIKEANLQFNVVYSSPLQRALKTAQIISEISHQPEPSVLNDLIERNFGVMTGVEQSKIEELCAPEIIKTDTITYFLSPKGAETFPDLLDRAERLLNMIKERHCNQKILLVSHGDFGKMIFAKFYNLPWKNVLTDFYFGNSEILHLSENINPKDAKIFTSVQHNH